MTETAQRPTPTTGQDVTEGRRPDHQAARRAARAAAPWFVDILTGHTSDVMSVACSPDARLATASADATARIWDPATGAIAGHTSYVYSVAWSPDGRHLANASGDQTALIWLIPPRPATPAIQS